MSSYKDKKVISIGIVSELTGISQRKIRYYEERGLIFPERSIKGIRKYSFQDVETLMKIAEKMEEGVQTAEIRNDMQRRKIRDEMIKGQLNAHFRFRNSDK
ncbi:MerR family transcriptional regulator [Pradoshia sp. D12]|uniref:MerR family transcriptional regulator n=1 Tax=Bacillaceae TaxID=186817 RepID=UPI00080AE938|nr:MULTISPECIES: MerR family transcriptional regulator [Bacillaceae]OCA86817.1 MerR family transcriptional regulator [Bacillus sp. FJAT-27986]QFK71415.1 MerR family transcriptional regulator [Pradoshia sp. D12]TPF73210.1 MerR family transcriptional regulator [Bacillus sp. D12]